MSDSEELRQRAEQYNHQLLTSEDLYVNELETIVNYIVKPLEKAAVRCKIKGGEDEVKKVFTYLKSMLQFHITFLSVIRETISVVPDLFKYIGFINMYDDYLNHYDEILHTFGKWRSDEFRQFVSMRLKHPDVKKNIIGRLDSLPWYLYRPFDRIKEYHRFLKDIEKIETRKGAASGSGRGSSRKGKRSLVSKTISQIRPLYKKIKLNEDRLQQKTRLLEVQLQIHGYNKSLLEDDRFFVYNRQCQMKKRGLTNYNKYKHIQIYLFNDLFLWVSARGRFKGCYSFYKAELEVALPSNCGKGDATFTIGLRTDKQKRTIVCADDVQRDKLMNTIARTYKQCQERYHKTLAGGDEDAIRLMKQRHFEHDDDEPSQSMISQSSVDTTRTLTSRRRGGGAPHLGASAAASGIGKSTAELSIASNDSRRSDQTDQSTTPNPPPPLPLPAPVIHSYSHSHNHNHNYNHNVHLNLTLSMNGGGVTSTDNEEVEHEHALTPQQQTQEQQQGEQQLQPQVDKQQQQQQQRKHRHHHKRHHMMKELEMKVSSLEKELQSKNDQIKDLSESNEAIRQTIALKDMKINALQQEVADMRTRVASHAVRAKSISNLMRPERLKRASSFSIGKDGKITRSAMIARMSNLNHAPRSSKVNYTLSTPGPSSAHRKTQSEISQ